MKTLTMEWIGIRPLLMNNPAGLDVLNPLVKQINTINAKRKKTDDDIAARDWLQYQVALYIADDIGPYVPTSNIEACIRDGGKKTNNGKAVQAAVFVGSENYSVLLKDGTFAVPLTYEGPREPKELYDSPDFRLRARVVQARQGVMKVRPRFLDWSLKFELEYDEGVISKADLKLAAENAGALIGLCDWRPKHGRFESRIV